jgi:thiol:disulfide interchange protein
LIPVQLLLSFNTCALYIIVHNNNIMKHLEPNQFDSLLASKEKALVMFYADWCPICQIFKPVSESAITTKSTSNGYKF